MASPQKENGFTPIANELYDALIRRKLSSYEMRVLIFLMRKTYGWHKKEDWISLSQFVLGTQIRESHVSRTLGLLLKQNMVTKGGKRSFPEWGIQKDFDKWIELPKGVRSHHKLKKGVIQITKGGKSNMKKGGDTKETNSTKETITKEKRVFDPLGAEIIKAFEKVDTKNKRYYRNTTQRGACDFLLEEYGLEEVLKRVSVLPRTNKIQFFPSIYTPLQLVEKWEQLQGAVDRKRGEVEAKKVKII